MSEIAAYCVVISWALLSLYEPEIGGSVFLPLFLNLAMVGRYFIPILGLVLRATAGIVVLIYSALIVLYLSQDGFKSTGALVGLGSGLLASLYLSWFYASWNPKSKDQDNHR